MPRLYVPLPNEVSYCYAYDQPISFGNTSQGDLKVEWMGGMEATLRRLAAVGVQAIPWGSVGADLLGEVRYEMLREMGLEMGCMGRIQGRTGLRVTIEQPGAPEQIALVYGCAESALPPLLKGKDPGCLYLYGEYAAGYRQQVLLRTGWHTPLALQEMGGALLAGPQEMVEAMADRLEALR